jgi:hypothetical protein
MQVEGTGAPKQSHLLRNVIIVLAVVLFTVGGVLVEPPVLFFNVTVSGTATLATHGATPVNVTFVDENGVPYVAKVGAGGNYSISLMNGHLFTVYIVYSTLAGSAGSNCSAGSLNLYNLGWTMSYDVSC